MAIAGRIVVEVILVVVLRLIEIFQRQVFHFKRLAVASLQFSELFGNESTVRRFRVVDARAVLRSYIISLSVEACRVDGLEIKVNKQSEVHLLRVVFHAYRFRRIRSTRTYLLISRICHTAVGVAYGRRLYAADLLHEVFRTPEASSGEIDFFCVHIVVVFCCQFLGDNCAAHGKQRRRKQDFFLHCRHIERFFKLDKSGFPMNFNIKTTYVNSIMFIENKSLLVLYFFVVLYL